jgi:glycosyltransferase involved in cell wall biosynthesis
LPASSDLDKKLRVLACAYTCSPTGEGEQFGGGEDILGWNVVNQLARFHRVWVLAHTRNRPSVERALHTEPASNLWFHYFELPRWFGPLKQFQGGIQLYALLWQIKANFEAQRLHRLYQFEAFHHVTYANDWMASYIGALLPVHYIRGPGGGAHRTPKKFLSHYGLKGRLWERVRSIGQWMFRHDPFFLIGQRRARAILVCNREAFEGLPEKWRHKAHMFSVCGVSSADLSLFSNERMPSSTFRVFSAGKLLRIKGFGLSIQAFARFSKNYPNVELTIAGDGPELRHLEDLAGKLGISKLVTFQKWMPRDELLQKMASSDVFLFSGLRDGGGAVVVEAMSMGTPVVCLDLSGPAMHVTQESGIKIAASSPERAVEQMEMALERLYLDLEMREKMGDAARKRARLVFHWDHTGDRLNEIYQHLNEPDTGI